MNEITFAMLKGYIKPTRRVKSKIYLPEFILVYKYATAGGSKTRDIGSADAIFFELRDRSMKYIRDIKITVSGIE